MDVIAALLDAAKATEVAYAEVLRMLQARKGKRGPAKVVSIDSVRCFEPAVALAMIILERAF